jgi:phosphotransferase system HPr-like phosphotransfer protein
MKITKRQLRRIIREERSRLQEVPQASQPAASNVQVTDVDNGREMTVNVVMEYDMLTVSFGNSMTLHLNSEDAKNLGETLVEFSEYLFVASQETLGGPEGQPI